MSEKPLLPLGLVRVYDLFGVEKDVPCLLSVPVTDNGRRFAEQTSTIEQVVSSQSVPLLDHAGAEASVWTQERAVSALARPSFLTARKPYKLNAKEFSALAQAYETMANDLQKAGLNTAVLALDDDGLLASALEAPGLEYSIEALVTQLSSVIPNLGVSLCVEALAPGGHDAITGIARAQKLATAGAQFVVASCGSWAFPPLKYRKTTKARGRTEVAQNDAWLASPAWLLGKIKCPVYACGPIQNKEKASLSALHLGFAGLINWTEPRSIVENLYK